MDKFWRKYNPWIGFNDIPFIVVGTPLVAIFVTLIFFGYSLHDAIICFADNVIAGVVSCLVFWLGDRSIVIWFRKKFPNPDETANRIVYQSIVILIYTAIMSVPLMLSKPMFFHPPGMDVPNPGYWKSFVACALATLMIVSIYEAAFFINRWKWSVAETEKLKQQHAESQLEALRSQINPHFLFNSLNTLASLIPEEPIKAVQFVQKLSAVYRSVLDLKERKVVTLSEELDLLRDYQFLIEMRFGKNVKFDYQIDSRVLSMYTVPLSLQMLVENAIKHNVASQKRPLHITIRSEENEMLIVENPMQLKDQQQSGTGTGLRNIENRYQLTYSRSIEVREEQGVFAVCLPLIAIDHYTTSKYLA